MNISSAMAAKITALILAVTHVVEAFNWYDLSEVQHAALATLWAAIAGVFVARDENAGTGVWH
jgi:hypothetical protein